jgi:uncharacterized protein YfaP (DUF2135 family)
MRGNKMRRVRVAAWLAGTVLLVSCGGGGGSSGTPPFQSDGPGSPGFGNGPGGGGGGGIVGDGARPAPDPTIQISTDALQGTVVSAETGSPIGGATGNVGGTALTADSSGFYSAASYAATNRVVAQNSATGFEPLYRPIQVVSGVPSVHLFKLVTQSASVSVDAAAGGTVQAANSPAQVVFPASAVTDAGGAAHAGNFEVRITPVSLGSDTYLLSGDYSAAAGQPLESFGGAIVSTPLDLRIAAGSTVNARIPVSSRNTAPPASARMYRLDTATGFWVDAGAATLVNDANGAFYQGAIDAFGQWMVGAPVTSTVIVRGCVNDESGAPAAGTRIALEGISYSNLQFATTDAAGQFAVPAKQNSTVFIQGQRGVFLSNAVSSSVGTSDVNIATCLTVPTGNAMTMKLTWGASPRDIDSHLHVPGGAHVYYGSQGSLTAEPFASLDVDDTSGNGPEVTTIRRPKTGIYRFFLHNFSNSFTPGMTGSPTRVELNYGGRTVVFTPPAGEGSALYWHLFDLEIGANCAMTLYRYNRWRVDQPANPNQNGANGQACVPN